MVTPAGSFTHDLLFPPAGERLSSTSDLFFTWFRPLGFCSASFSWAQRHLSFFTVVLCRLKGNRKYQTLASSFGYPPATGEWSLLLVWKIMSHLVRLTNSVKTTEQRFCQNRKMIRQSSLFWDVSVGNCGAGWGWEKGMWVKVQLIIKVPVVALLLYSPLNRASPHAPFIS